MSKAPSTAKSREFNPVHDTTTLSEEILSLKKQLKSQNRTLKNKEATIRRLSRVNAEKDKIISESEFDTLENQKKNLQNPAFLRKRIAKLQVFIVEKDLKIEQLTANIKNVDIAELQAELQVYQEEILRLKEIIEVENEPAQEDEDFLPRHVLVKHLDALKDENRRLKTAKAKRPASAASGMRKSEKLTENEKQKLQRLVHILRNIFL